MSILCAFIEIAQRIAKRRAFSSETKWRRRKIFQKKFSLSQAFTGHWHLALTKYQLLLIPAEVERLASY